MLGGIAANPYRVQWCGWNNPLTWTPDPVTQAGYQDLTGHAGRVQKIVPGDRGLIFQERSIHRMIYVGPKQIFQFDEIERQHGTHTPRSICWTGDHVFYYSPQGFFEILGDQGAVPIGQDRIDRWVDTNVSDKQNIVGVIDPLSKTVLWSVRVSTTTGYDTILLYRWDIQAWGLVKTNHLLVSPNIERGVDLDSDVLDTFYDSNVDNPERQVSLDSPRWASGTISLNAFDMDKRRGLFEGNFLPAALETGFRNVLPEYNKAFINKVRPILNSQHQQTATVTVRMKDNLLSSNERTFQKPLRPTGQADIRAKGRYGSFRLDILNEWDGFLGFNIHARQAGYRD